MSKYAKQETQDVPESKYAKLRRRVAEKKAQDAPESKYAKLRRRVAEKRQANAEDLLLNGIDQRMTPEQRAGVDSVLSPQEQSHEQAKAVFSNRDGIEYSDEMTNARVEARGGPDATAQVVMEMDKKALSIKEKAIEPIKSLARGVQNLEAVPGHFIEMFGDWVQAQGQQWNRLYWNSSLGKKKASELREEHLQKPLAQRQEEEILKAPDVTRGEKIEKFGKMTSTFWEEAASTGWEKRDPRIYGGTITENFSLTRIFGGVFESLPAMALAAGTGGTFGPLLLAATEGAPVYTDAKEKGLNPKEAFGYATTSMAGSYILEKIGFDAIFGGDKGLADIAKQTSKEWVAGALLAAASEGVTESLQSLYSNALASGYDKSIEIFEGVLESGLVGLFSGGSIKSSSDASLMIKEHMANIAEKAKKVTPEQIKQALVEGDFKPDVTESKALSLGDFNEIRANNTDEQIIEMVKNDPKTEGKPKAKALLQEASLAPDEAKATAYNEEVFVGAPQRMMDEAVAQYDEQQGLSDQEVSEGIKAALEGHKTIEQEGVNGETIDGQSNLRIIKEEPTDGGQVIKKPQFKVSEQQRRKQEALRRAQPVDQALAKVREDFKYLQKPKKSDPLYNELVGTKEEKGLIPAWRWRNDPKYPTYDQAHSEIGDRVSHITNGLSASEAMGAIYKGRLKTVGQAELDLKAEESQFIFDDMTEDINNGLLPPESIMNEYPDILESALRLSGVDASSLNPVTMPDDVMRDLEAFVEKYESELDQSNVIEQRAEKVDLDADIKGISKDQMNQWRETWDLENTPDTEQRLQVAVIEEAKESGIDAQTLIDSITEKPRPITDTEGGVLLLEKTNIMNNKKATIKKRNKAMKDGKEELVLKFNDELESLRRQADKLSRATRLAGGKLGQGLAALNMRMDAETFELEAVIDEARTEKGSELTDEEQSKIENEIEELDKVQEKIDDKEAALGRKEKSDKSIEEQIAVLRENIEEASRSIAYAPKKKQKKTKTEKQKELALLKEIQKDQDTIFALIESINKQEIAVIKSLEKADPEGYKATIKNLNKEIRESEWFAKLEASKSKSDKKRLAQLKVLLKDLDDQLKGQYRRLKKGKAVESEQVESLKSKVEEIRKKMRLEDELSAAREDLRLIIDGRLNETDFMKEKKRRENVRDELEDDRAELKAIQSKIRQTVYELGEHGAGRKTMAVFDFLRANILSLDSWIGRQGSKALLSDPITTGKVWIESLPTLIPFISESCFYEVDRQNSELESAKHGVKHGLELMDIDGTFQTHQEAANSKLAEKIPWVRGSNRHMILGLNLLRTRLYSKILNRFPGKSDAFYNNAAKIVNELTGRGSLPGMEKAAHGLSAVFTAPRWTTSNWQYIVSERNAYITDEKTGKKVLDKDLLRVIVEQKAKAALAFGTLATMMIAMGWELEEDPEEGDFLKLRKGDLVFDPMPGLTSNLRLLGLLVENALATRGIGEMEGHNDYTKIADQYLAYKYAPSISLARELITGKSAGYDERKLLESLALAPIPIMVQTVYQDLIKDDEAWSDVLWETMVQFPGFGAQIYEDRDL